MQHGARGPARAHLIHGHAALGGAVAVDLVARRVLQAALGQVPQHLAARLEELQVKLRKVQHLCAPVRPSAPPKARASSALLNLSGACRSCNGL